MTKQMSKKGQRLFALLLAVVMMLSAMPLSTTAVTTNSDGYIEVSTIEDLYNIRDNLTANYILMNDIDLTEATAEGGDWDFMGNGWNPIGSGDVYGDGAFTGVFDGNGYSITGMRIYISQMPSGIGSSIHLGLFAKVSGTVCNLNLTGSIYGRKNVGVYAGGVCGVTTASAKIENISNSVSVNVGYSSTTTTSKEVHSGGIVGYNAGTIHRSSNSGNVTGVGMFYSTTNYGSNVHCYAYARVGGISGYSSGRQTQCYNTGTVTGGKIGKNGGVFAGGIIGCGESSSTEVVACYNAGDVTITFSYDYAHACGIVGSGSCSVSQSYNTGLVDDYAIGAGSSTNCYYLSGSGFSNTGSTALTETQMKIQSMYKGFDFENLWVLNKYANYPYPQLQSNIQDLNESAELVSIITLPTKTEYFTGDTLDFTGSMVKVVYVSGKEEIIDITDDIVSGFDMSVAGEQQVTVTVAGASDTYTIDVKERPVVSGVSIILEPDTKVFAVGTAFDFSGAKAKISYVGGVTEYKDITVEATTGGNINHVGKQTITYTFGGKSAVFEVEVVGVTLEKIVLTELPERLAYLEGQELDLTGMVVTAVMNNGIESTVATGYTVSGYSSQPGTYTVTVTYLEKTATFEVTVANRTLVSLALNTLPDKLEYISGQEFDDAGMQLVATYDNGDVEVADSYTVSGFDNTPGIKTIVVSLDGQSVSFPAKVIARVIIDFRLVSAPSKLDYIEYEAFDATGLKVEATYNDGVTEEIKDYQLAGFSSNPGTHTITIAYEGFVKSFEINVIPRVLEDVRVKVPNKVIYSIGEEFDTTGMVVTACYNNGQEIIVDDYQMTEFSSSAPGAKTITVTYGGISRSFVVVVQERSVIETGGNMIVGNLTGRLGETVVVPVNVTKNTGIAGFTHTITFDETALKFVSANAEGDYADGTLVVNKDKANEGAVTILWFGNNDVKGDGIVYNLAFEILETAQDGNSEIAISFDTNDNGNISGENVIFDTINGSVEVLSYWLGDLDGDRKFEMVDLLQLAQYVSGKAMDLTEKQKLSADVNEDGTIDIHDVVMLNQWLLVADM